jgi:tetrapyrrole methylase family protein/MazG family protein
MNDKDRIKSEFEMLVDTVAALRGPDGCPWDREQDHMSLRKYMIEESYEAIEAIEQGSASKMKEELGDVLLQVLLHSEIADENNKFDIADVCQTIREKLIRRHPHVFGEVEVSGVDDVLSNWESIKRAEPGYEDRKSVLDGIPKHMPALMRAMEVSKKAAKTGFEWPDIHGVFDKLHEEIQELKDEIETGHQKRIGEEIGDILFTVVNVARWHGIDAEESLREMLERFTARFKVIENAADESGRDISDLSIEEMDAIWDKAKGKKHTES